MLKLTITQLRCFVEVAKELNYAKAAANLYISQPAVSRHIISLEKELGVTLLAEADIMLHSLQLEHVFIRKQRYS